MDNKRDSTNPEGSSGPSRLSGFTGLIGLGSNLPFFGGRRGSASQERWVCPNDRQLALRAKLKMGWSTGQQTVQQTHPETLSEAETKRIMDVIQRAEELDVGEQARVGRLVEKVETMKGKCQGNGTTSCILCGSSLPLIRTHNLICALCSKSVCTKCGVEAHGVGRESLWLCKICAETREMWKRSGAWFFRGLPKHVMPSNYKQGSGRKSRAPKRWNTMSLKGSANSEENETSSEDEVLKRNRFQKASSECVQEPQEGAQINLPFKPPKPTGIPPLTPDPSPYPLPRSRSVSPSPLRIDLTGTRKSLEPEDRIMDRSPISPDNFGRRLQSSFDDTDSDEL